MKVRFVVWIDEYKRPHSFTKTLPLQEHNDIALTMERIKAYYYEEYYNKEEIYVGKFAGELLNVIILSRGF